MPLLGDRRCRKLGWTPEFPWALISQYPTRALYVFCMFYIPSIFFSKRVCLQRNARLYTTLRDAAFMAHYSILHTISYIVKLATESLHFFGPNAVLIRSRDLHSFAILHLQLRYEVRKKSLWCFQRNRNSQQKINSKNHKQIL